ncbi:Uncharacterised protein [Alcaligenes faecalis subsp. faecalis]|nr:Uncharacterised protein [Alcaligenes faecalis subsp. faecalis]
MALLLENVEKIVVLRNNVSIGPTSGQLDIDETLFPKTMILMSDLFFQ